MGQNSVSIALPQKRTARIISALGLAFFGLSLVYGIGFAHSHLLHNAAHDVRHSSGFPCH